MRFWIDFSVWAVGILLQRDARTVGSNKARPLSPTAGALIGRSLSIGSLIVLIAMVVAGVRGMREHHRQDRADLATRWLPAVAVTPPRVPETTTDDRLPRLTLITGANIRQAPSASAPILRVGHRGEILAQFATTTGWIRVGTDKPEGWVSQRLTR